jgi:predicted RNA-binding protein with PUA domain
MKTFNKIGIIVMFGLMAFGYVMKLEQDKIIKKQNETINKQGIVIINLNNRVTGIGRTVNSKMAMVSKEDWEKHPEWQKHINENHTSYGKGCLK